MSLPTPIPLTTIPTSGFPSLQLQCLYYLVGRLEEYSSQSLSLLPSFLRHQLLLRLPVADIFRLENDAAFMSGLDADVIWRCLLECRVSFQWDAKLRELLRRHPTAKDGYLSEVAVILLTGEWPWGRYKFPHPGDNYQLKSDTIIYMLYGTRLECDDMQDMNLFTKRSSLDITWLVPHRYSSYLAMDKPLQMVEMFLDKFNWYPKRLYLYEDYDIDQAFMYSGSRILQLLLSHVEAINIDIDDYSNSIFAESLEPVWEAVGVASSLESVTLSACVTNLGDLVSCMLQVLFEDAIDKDVCGIVGCDRFGRVEEEEVVIYKYSGLKSIEVLGNDAGTHPHEHGYTGSVIDSTEHLIPFLDFQVGLETVSIEGLFNIYRVEDVNDQRYNEYVSDYEYFEPFYNYLPYVISKPTFKLLRLKNCHIPVNSVKSVISTFLARATESDLSLELSDCFMVEKSDKTYSERFPLIYQAANIPCVCGQFKSLRFDITGSTLFSLQWLFEYPQLQLNRLELSYMGPEHLDVQVFDSYPSSSIDTLCCRLCHLGYGDMDKLGAVIFSFLRIPFLSEIEISRMCDYDDSVFSVLTEVFMQPFRLTSLKRLRLEKFSAYRVKIRTFLDALFRMPKEQLAEFTFELIEVTDSDPEVIIQSWKINSHGQRLKKFAFAFSPGYNMTRVDLPISEEHFSDIAVSVSERV